MSYIMLRYLNKFHVHHFKVSERSNATYVMIRFISISIFFKIQKEVNIKHDNGVYLILAGVREGTTSLGHHHITNHINYSDVSPLMNTIS